MSVIALHKMLEFLKTHFYLINLGHIVVTTLMVLGILRPISNSKSRIKKKIIQKLTEEYNRNEILFPEIRLRDNLLFRSTSLISCIFLRNFYTSFIESIRELETEDMIVRVSNSELELDIDKKGEKYPSYSSKAKKTPANYGLKKDDPTVYLGLSSPKVKNHIATLKQIRVLMASTMLKSVSNETLFGEFARRSYDLTKLREWIK